MSNIIDSYYNLPEEEILADPNMTDKEKLESLGTLIRRPRSFVSEIAEEVDPNPLRTIEQDVLALVLFWSDTDVTPPEEHGGTRYNYWCNILRDNARWEDPIGTQTIGTGLPRPDFDFDKVVMTPRKKDIEQSKKIIDYYKLKLSHRALTGDIPFSEYENKLGSFINSLPGQFKFEELGVIVRLPETYNVDLVFDEFIEKYDSLPPSEPEWFMTVEPDRHSLVLNFIKKIIKS